MIIWAGVSDEKQYYRWEATFLVGRVKVCPSFDQHEGNLPLTIPGKEMTIVMQHESCCVGMKLRVTWRQYEGDVWGQYDYEGNLAAMWRGVRLSSSAVLRSAPPCMKSFLEFILISKIILTGGNGCWWLFIMIIRVMVTLMRIGTSTSWLLITAWKYDSSVW